MPDWKSAPCIYYVYPLPFTYKRIPWWTTTAKAHLQQTKKYLRLYQFSANDLTEVMLKGNFVSNFKHFNGRKEDLGTKVSRNNNPITSVKSIQLPRTSYLIPSPLLAAAFLNYPSVVMLKSCICGGLYFLKRTWNWCLPLVVWYVRTKLKVLCLR